MSTLADDMKAQAEHEVRQACLRRIPSDSWTPPAHKDTAPAGATDEVPF